MTYAAAPTVQADVLVSAPPQQLWDLVIDVERQASWSRELQHVEWLDAASGPALGACFLGHNRNDFLGPWRTVSRIVEFEPERAFSWLVIDVDKRFCLPGTSPTEPMATWRFDLDPVSAGTRLRQSVRIGPGRSGLSLAIDSMPEREEELVTYRLGQLRTSMQATLAALKALVEQVNSQK